MEKNEFEIIGEWWLPENPDDKVFGRLKFDDENGGDLELYGPSEGTLRYTHVYYKEVILGRNTGFGDKITLFDCMVRSFPISSPGVKKLVVNASTVLIGEHYDRGDKVEFRSLSINFEGIENWFRGVPVKVDFPSDDEVIIDSIEPTPVTWVLPGGTRVSIKNHTVTPLHFGWSGYEAQVKQYVEVIFQPPSPKKLREYDPCIYHIRDFFALAMGRPIYVNYKLGDVWYYDETEGGSFKRCRPIPVRVFTRSSIRKEYPVSRNIRGHIFDYPDIKNNVGEFMANWFSGFEEFRNICSLYFGEEYSAELVLEYRFLTLAKVIEVFCRFKYGGGAKYQNDCEYKEGLMREFLELINNAQIDKGFKESLRGRVKYLNEFSLLKRIKILLDDFASINQLFIPNREEFGRLVKDTRDYYTHYDPTQKNDIASGEELLYLYWRLKVLVIVCLLSTIGFGEEKIQDLIQEGLSRGNFGPLAFDTEK
jgi:hypothetical protein